VKRIYSFVTLVRMGADDWYRGTDWSAETQELFEAKLARARQTSRAQYLRIKGVGLTAAADAATRSAGRDLLRRVVTEYPSDALQANWAHGDLAASLMQANEVEEAAEHYSAALTSDRPEPSAAVGLAEVIVLARWARRYEQALALLIGVGSEDARAPFPATRFRWNLVAARLCDRLGKRDDARELAAIALRCLDQTQSPFPRHRSIGLATADARTRRELEQLAKK
jgi:tetratricopeptide (TPR) repeat protein